jgi:four helix bundle protein
LGMPSNFNDLVAYRLAVVLAGEVYAAAVRWPAFDRSTLGEQIVKSSASVAANIAESTGRWSKADKRRALYIARGELHETEHWLNVAKARGLIRSTHADRVAEIARALNGLIDRPTPK